MASKTILRQPPKTGDSELDLYLSQLVGDIQRALDGATIAARLGVQVSNVTAPTVFDASTATNAQTASFVGGLYGAFKKAGKIS